MLNNTISWFVGFVLCTLFYSCTTDHLYYASDQTATVHFDINWDESHLTPNGVSAWVYRKDGGLYKKFSPFDNRKSINLSLPEGAYNIIFFNNSTSEFSDNLMFKNTDNFFHVMAAPIKVGESKLSNIPLIEEPDTLATARFMNLEITANQIDYFYNKPAISSKHFVEEYTVTPVRNTTLFYIIAHVKGLKNVAQAPKMYFGNVTSGYEMGENLMNSDLGIHSFILNNRKMDADNPKNGTIYKKLNSFGFQGDLEKSSYLDIDFVLLNGEHYPVHVDVSDKMRKEGTYQPTIIIQLEIELPEVIGGGENTEGPFETDVDDWEEEEIDIPL